MRRRKRSGTNYEATVQGLGQQLFDFALSGEVLAQLRACQRAAKSQYKEGVRLRLRIFDPELAGLPWEYLYDGRLRDFIALDPTLPLVRYLHHPHAAHPLMVSTPLRILGMIASPLNLQALDVESEKERVEQSVAMLQSAGKLELVWLRGDSALDLQSELRKGPWHIFHFIGHGDFDLQRDEGYLALCNPRNKRAEPLYATQLARLLAAQGNHLRFVLLNACESARGSSSDIFSSTAETLINRDIPAVLAMQYSITDEAAILFVEKLYELLADGLPIDRGVAEARNALALVDSQNLEWGIPVLHMRSPDGILFEVGSSQANEFDRMPEKSTKLVNHEAVGIVRQCTIDFNWVDIPEGEFLLGAKRKPPPKTKNKKVTLSNLKKTAGGDYLARENEIPQRRVWLDHFKISKTPITNAQYKEFVESTGHPMPIHWKNGSIPIGKEDHPVVYVSWYDAQKFCKWANVRLPSEMEWEKAARGFETRIYPWGWDAVQIHTRCNTSESGIGDTTSVTQYPLGVSGFGVLDMAGNTSEWTSSRWLDNYSDLRKFKREISEGENPVIRGGAYYKLYTYARCTSRDSAPANLSVHWLGFRVVVPLKVQEFEVRDRD